MQFFLLTCFLGLASSLHPAEWWRTLITSTSELTLSNGKFTGNLVDMSIYGIGEKIEVYTGVPYGVVDRFNPPMPVSASNDTFSATSAAVPCFQKFIDGRTGAYATEDCLTVDIYRPEGSTGAAVLFWIHGGAFILGEAAAYEGIQQAMRGNIVVIIQYRLSIFGFLNMFDESNGKTESGNFGLMDQQLALKYISENAENMGGDASKITINGESAGGMSVALHLLNPTSASYIHAAIAQSGSTKNAFIFEYFQKSNANWHTVCSKLDDCNSHSSILDFQNTLAEAESYKREIENLTALEIWNAVENTPAVIVGPVPTDGTFFTTDPREFVKTNTVPINIPYFITVNSFEGSLLQESEYPNGNFSLTEMARRLGVPDITSVTQQTLETYNTASGTNATIPLTYEQELAIGRFIYGDFMFRIPAREEADAYANAGGNVYVGYFDMNTKIIDYMKFPPEESCCGVPHFGELIYTFSWLVPGAARVWEYSVADYIINQFSTIIQTGAPHSDHESDWPKYTGINGKQMVLGNNRQRHLVDLEEIIIPNASKDATNYWRDISPIVETTTSTVTSTETDSPTTTTTSPDVPLTNPQLNRPSSDKRLLLSPNWHILCLIFAYFGYF